jgi:integrase/recombinase XerD
VFSKFLEEKKYLNGVSEKTLSTYNSAYIAYKRIVGNLPPTKETTKEFILGLQKSGVSVCTVNCYARSFNSYLTWLYSEGHIKAPLKIRLLREQLRVFKTLTDDQVRSIINFKPATSGEKRLHTLLLFLIDTGCRIDEALTLRKSLVDFENLLVTLKGKGNKQRIIPFSIELRKVLYKYLSNHQFELVFCNKTGTKLLYDNTRRDFNKLMKKLRIECDGAFHTFRRTFARNFARNGGNVFYLQKFLGHSTLTMSRRYVELETKDLQLAHQSLLTRNLT